MSDASEYSGLPKSAWDARALGLKRYFTGKPCNQGHISDRVVGGTCCQCSRERCRMKYNADPKSSMQRARAYALRNPDANYKAHLKRAYGLSLEQYSAILSAQNNRCAVCGTDDPQNSSSRWNVDHCHASGEVRGILCRPCNHMLGLSRDDPARLLSGVDYLNGYRVPAYSLASSLLSLGA